MVSGRYITLADCSRTGNRVIHLSGWLNKSKIETREGGTARKAIAILPVTNLTGNPDLAWIPRQFRMT